MKHLMRDVAQLREMSKYPIREVLLSPDEVNDGKEHQDRLMLLLRMVQHEFFELLEGAIGECHASNEAKRLVEGLLEEWQQVYDYNAIKTAEALTNLTFSIVNIGLELGMPLDVLWAEIQRVKLANGADLVGLSPPDVPLEVPHIVRALEQPSDAWAHSEVEALNEMGMHPGQQGPFRYLLERYNQLENHLKRVTGRVDEAKRMAGVPGATRDKEESLSMDELEVLSRQRTAAVLGVSLEEMGEKAVEPERKPRCTPRQVAKVWGIRPSALIKEDEKEFRAGGVKKADARYRALLAYLDEHQ